MWAYPRSLVFWNRKSHFCFTVKSLPVQTSWKAIISFNCLPLSHKQRRLTFKDPLVSLASFLLRNCRYNGRGLDGERNRAWNSLLHKKNKMNKPALSTICARQSRCENKYFRGRGRRENGGSRSPGTSNAPASLHLSPWPSWINRWFLEASGVFHMANFPWRYFAVYLLSSQQL